MRQGDHLRERARIGPVIGESEWTVVEHARPHRVVLAMPATRLGDLRITYEFAPSAQAVEFSRKLRFNLDNLPPPLDRTAVERQMQTESAEALRRLKQLVEAQLVQPLD